jgi:hypothetical protein
MKNKIILLAVLGLLAACSNPAPYHVDARSRGAQGKDVVEGGPTGTIGGGFPSFNHMLHCNFKASFCPSDD